ncbi:HpcH/HpaI aldolase family protein [Amycolatopsis jejuensis]|uniref:HpcH/HpaI aldolase family protein n=1 Tax=Amycolatopsis jejuensis TaxID=330084 RepID=UPI000526644D|nr:aldolase/citrate lyase family protein [Amycolatopsis jejuensis]
MRTNRLRALLAEDRPLFGAFMNFATPRQVEFVGHLGFDWVLLDAEHDGLTVDQAYQLVSAADAVGLGTVVRASANRPEVLLGFAETGANCIIAPHVTDRQAAEDLVAALAYPPVGRRGLGAGSRAANYGLTQTPAEYFAATDTHTMPAALLEDVSAYDDLDEILAVPGLEVCCLGAGDLSGSLGVPGQFDHPEVVRRVTDAAARISAAGKVISTSVGDGAAARASAAMGARLIAVSNTGLLGKAGREFLAQAREPVPA